MIFEQQKLRSRGNSQEKQKLTTNGSGKLHIGNLPFTLQEQDIKDEFERLYGRVIDVRIIRKNITGLNFKDYNYGFIHLENPHQADLALQNFQKMSDKNWIISTYNDKSKTQFQRFQLLPQPLIQLPLPPVIQINKLQQISCNLQVRELFLGNLTSQIDQKLIENTFGIYGDIENIDYYQKQPVFAFIKFKKVQDAIKAKESQQTIALLLNKIDIKILFSDHEKRPNIVGDQSGYETQSDLTQYIYAGFHGNVKLMETKLIKKEFERYGDVIDIYIKQSNFQQTGLRSFCIVEMASIEQAKKVYKKYMKEDRSSDRRQRLGDKRCDVQMILKPNQNQLSNQKFNLNLQTQKQGNYNFVDMVSQMVERTQEEPKNAFWSGFLTRYIKQKRSRQHRLGVDAFLLEGQEPNFFDYNLNLSHRIAYEEILKKNVYCITIFQPSNETQTKLFQEYIKYFQEKQRAGVINIQGNCLYIIPSCLEINPIYQLSESQLLGIFCDHNNELNRINLQQYIQQKLDPKKEKMTQDTDDQNILNHMNDINEVLPLLDNPEIIKFLKDV